MVHQLTKQNQQELLKLVKAGDFSSEDEAISEALKLLENQLKAKRLNEKLQSASDQIARGQLINDSPEWREARLQNLIERFNAGERADPDYFD